MNDSPHKVFSDFLRYLSINFPAYDVAGLLNHLQIHGTIDPNEAAMIRKAIGPTDRAKVLLLEIMPSKDRRLQKELVDVLRRNGNTEFADFLETRLDELDRNRKAARAPAAMAGAAASDSNSGNRHDGGNYRTSTSQQLALVGSDDRRRIYEDFCSKIDAEFPVETLVKELRRVNAITLSQSDAIKNQNNNVDKISTLFQQIMATIQDRQSHERLIRALEYHKHVDDANFLRRNLFR